MNAIAGVARGVTGDLLGRGARSLDTLGEVLSLAGAALSAAARDIFARRFSWSEFLLQAWFMVRVSLLPTVLVSIPFGVIVAVQIGGISQQIGASSMQGAVNGVAVLRQGAPLVTSLVIAGVVGSAITSDMGARQVREEIDAMRVMGINPVQRLVAPRLLAALAVSLFLTAIVASVSILTTYFLVVGRGDVGSGTFFDGFASFARVSDLELAILKSLIFGFIATVVAAHKGLSARGGPKGVADAVNQAVVLSVILLAVVNVGLTQAYVMLVPDQVA